MTHFRLCLPGTLAAGVLLFFAGAACGAETLAAFDFIRPEVVAQWKAVSDVDRASATADGMRVAIAGPDPYLVGPPVDLPEGADLWLRLRLRSEAGGLCQVFYAPAGRPFAQGRSVRVRVPAGAWVERRVALPALGPTARFRIDPPGAGGTATIAWLRLERRTPIEPPEWPAPVPSDLPAGALAARSGDLTVRYDRADPARLAVEVAGTPMAGGLAPMRIGYVAGDATRWIPWEDGHRDPDGGTWRISRTVTAGRDGSVEVAVRVTVDRPREVVFLPMLALVAGQGTFGATKRQAVFAGLEYLADEPSSSEKDIRGLEADRRVPAAHKITFPLMAVAAEGRYVGLVWDRDPHLAAVFDSPDRTFGSGGHVMGVVFPGARSENRTPGRVLPRWPARLEANEPLVLRARVIGGRGETAVPAIEHYVRLRGLPPLPETVLDAQDYVRLAADGWLKSAIREGDRYKHAVWQGKWNAHPAAGPGVWLRHLARGADEADLAARLRKAADAAVDLVPPGRWYHSGVSHVQYPAVPLVYGHVAERVEGARRSARGQIRRFEPDGGLPYRPRKAGPDYASTHWSREANGLAARPVRDALEAAVYAGDADLVREGLRLLRALDRFAGTVPRGAQTWEVPLHTPDILASAHLVRAYTVGYELTGEARFLEQARYWAWTGVPFVYLTNPTDGPVGPYSTIAVLGATNWRAPVWFGRPVQWCGMVYADALYGLARHDSDGPWKQLADGITAAGIQHTWKQDDAKRQGLLPDFFELRNQVRAGPAINPGTVQAGAVRLYDMPPVYDYAVCRKAGVYVHAPGRVRVMEESEAGVSLIVAGWPEGTCRVLVTGLTKRPRVRIGGADAPGESVTWLDAGAVVLRVTGEVRVELDL
ncbi:MAG: hypothetical protein R6X20_18545 [Phycisphaerae bacterium]